MEFYIYNNIYVYIDKKEVIRREELQVWEFFSFKTDTFDESKELIQKTHLKLDEIMKLSNMTSFLLSEHVK